MEQLELYCTIPDASGDDATFHGGNLYVADVNHTPAVHLCRKGFSEVLSAGFSVSLQSSESGLLGAAIDQKAIQVLNSDGSRAMYADTAPVLCNDLGVDEQGVVIYSGYGGNFPPSLYRVGDPAPFITGEATKHIEVVEWPYYVKGKKVYSAMTGDSFGRYGRPGNSGGLSREEFLAGPLSNLCIGRVEDMAVNADGSKLTFSDSINDRVVEVDLQAGTFRTLVGNPFAAQAATAGPIVPGETGILDPAGLAYDSDGNLFIAETVRSGGSPFVNVWKIIPV